MNLRSLKRLLPRRLSTAISASRRIEAAVGSDQKLLQKRVELEHRHIENLRVVLQRRALLESVPQGGIAVEVGVADGDFSLEILETIQPKKLHLIDVWESEDSRYSEQAFDNVRSRMQSEIAQGIVETHRMFSWDGLKELPDQSIDFVYIDASHRYEDVARDLAAALPKMKANGIIAGHDYITWSSACVRFGVVEAVNEFCVREDFEMILLTTQANRHLSYALRRISAAGKPPSVPRSSES